MRYFKQSNTIMKGFFNRFTCIAALIACIIYTGCEANVDLGNIDTSTSVKAELALPIGCIRAELGDFLGDSVIENLSIDDNGCYVYRDTFHSRKSFHEIDLSSYMSTTNSTLNIYQQLIQNNPELDLLSYVPLPADTTFYLDFALPFVFNGINNDLQTQRIDSIIVAEANFVSNISTKGLSSLTWDEIESIEIILNPETFRRPSMEVEVPISGYNFGRNIPVILDDFHLILMKDPNAKPSFENIIDSTSFTIRFHFRTKRMHYITSDSELAYNFQINFMKYDAIFGYFQASNFMRDEQVDMSLSEYWTGWNSMEGFMLPLREPSIFLGIEHAIAVPLKLTLKDLCVKSKSGEEKYLTFNGERQKSVFLEPDIQVTDPLTAHSYDTIRLDHTPENGNLGEIMTIHPDKMSYTFSVTEDTNYDMPQYRLVDDTDVKLSMGAEFPFKFNPGTQIFFADTLDNLRIDRLSLDSLLANMAMIDTINEAQLTLFLNFENYIPFAVTAELDFLDKNGEVIPFDGLSDIQLNYPKIETFVATEPGKCQVEIVVNHADLNKLASVGALRYALTLGENTDPVDLRKDAKLNIYVGVKANVDMVLDLGAMFNNNELEETL